MQKKILIERSEKERKKEARNGGVGITLALFVVLGLLFTCDLLENYLSIDEVVNPHSFFLKLGVVMVILFGIFLVYLIGYIIVYNLEKYKEIEPKNEPKPSKSTRRRK